MDYPILSVVPETSFSCSDRPAGMYADIETRCQAWHQCWAERKWTFLCPNGTIFNQEIFTCVWWFDFDCQNAEQLYSVNEDLYKSSGGEGESDYTREAADERFDNHSGPKQKGQNNDQDERISPLLPVTSELEEDYEDDELSGYQEQVTVSGPTPAPKQADRLYGAPRLGRRRKGRKTGRRGNLRKRQRVFGKKKY